MLAGTCCLQQGQKTSPSLQIPAALLLPLPSGWAGLCSSLGKASILAGGAFSCYPLHQALGGGLASWGHLEVQRERRRERVKGRDGWVRLCTSGCPSQLTPSTGPAVSLQSLPRSMKESCQMLSCFTNSGELGGGQTDHDPPLGSFLHLPVSLS